MSLITRQVPTLSIIGPSSLQFMEIPNSSPVLKITSKFDISISILSNASCLSFPNISKAVISTG